MPEDLAQCFGVALEFLEEILAVARLKVENRDVLEQRLNIFLVLLKALTVPHHIWLGRHEALEVRLLMRAEIHLDGVLVVGITQGLRHQRKRCRSEVNIPLGQHCKGTVIRHRRVLHRGGNGLFPEVILQSDGGGVCCRGTRCLSGLLGRIGGASGQRQCCNRNSRSNLGGSRAEGAAGSREHSVLAY